MVSFVTPPPISGRGPESRYLPKEVREELKRSPGEYGLIATNVPRGSLRAVHKHPGFVGMTRTEDGITNLYVKYEGE